MCKLSIPREFIHCLYDLSSLDPSTSSSINAACCYTSSASSGGSPCRWLKISAVKTVLSLRFPDAISDGVMNGTNPSLSAAKIICFDLSLGSFYKFDSLMHDGSIEFRTNVYTSPSDMSFPKFVILLELFLFLRCQFTHRISNWSGLRARRSFISSSS